MADFVSIQVEVAIIDRGYVPRSIDRRHHRVASLAAGSNLHQRDRDARFTVEQIHIVKTGQRITPCRRAWSQSRWSPSVPASCGECGLTECGAGYRER